MKLSELIDVEILQQIQDSFSKFIGMASITTDPDGVPVTKPSNFSKFCIEMTRETLIGNRRCEECDKMGAKKTLESGHATTYFCHAGLMDFAAPIMLNDKIIGSIVGGQVRTGDVDEEAMEKIAIELGLDPEKYVEAAKQTRVLDEKYINRSAIYLSEIAGVISGMAYQSFVALQKSHELEQNAYSQSRYTVGQMSKMKRELNHWRKIMNSVDRSALSADAQKMLHVFNNQSNDMIMEIQNTEEYLDISLGNIQLKEDVYNVREQVRNVVNEIGMFNDEVLDQVSVSVEDKVPEYLLGDAGRVSMIFAKMIQSGMSYLKKEKFSFVVSSERKEYATWLVVSAGTKNSIFSKSELQQMGMKLENKGLDSAEKINSMVDEQTIFAMVVHQMSGSIEFCEKEDGETQFIVRIPQLEIVREE